MEKLIEVKNLTFVYPDGTEALIDINLNIYSGEFIAFIGQNVLERAPIQVSERPSQADPGLCTGGGIGYSRPRHY